MNEAASFYQLVSFEKKHQQTEDHEMKKRIEEKEDSFNSGGDFCRLRLLLFELIEFDGRIVSVLLLSAPTASLPHEGEEIEPQRFEKPLNSLRPLLATGRGSPWQQRHVRPAGRQSVGY